MEACPTNAIVFGDLLNPNHKITKLLDVKYDHGHHKFSYKNPRAFRLLEKFGTQPKVFYLTSHEWIKRMGDNYLASEKPGKQRKILSVHLNAWFRLDNGYAWIIRNTGEEKIWIRLLIHEGADRCGLGKFSAWAGLLSRAHPVGTGQRGSCLLFGLNQTNMNDYFAFGLWIVFDLAVIGLGAGAFSTGLLTHIIRMHDLKAIVNAAVIIGFLCYSGAVLMLGIDIGQPIRGWFIFWHANVHSMLTEVSFCITTYLIVLIIEYLPIILEQRHLDKIPELHYFGHNLHSIVIVFAGVGTFLSFFHQGSLGGMFGVLYGRPFAYRGHFLIWPSTFGLFILSAVAWGPAFTAIIVWITQKVANKRLVPKAVLAKMGQDCGHSPGDLPRPEIHRYSLLGLCAGARRRFNVLQFLSGGSVRHVADVPGVGSVRGASGHCAAQQEHAAEGRPADRCLHI